ncbi:hypothetical protein WJX75_009806 [Coccomyxa subellipsoidea]|uniref:Uncharacterized protein n=1 Tax=Coccomyxa subellipsoidea TaxID=248742 RepID=A0ABR2Z4P6_9CHLO
MLHGFSPITHGFSAKESCASRTVRHLTAQHSASVRPQMPQAQQLSWWTRRMGSHAPTLWHDLQAASFGPRRAGFSSQALGSKARSIACLAQPGQDLKITELQNFLEGVEPGFARLYAQPLYDAGYDCVKALASASVQNLREYVRMPRGHALLVIPSAARALRAAVGLSERLISFAAKIPTFDTTKPIEGEMYASLVQAGEGVIWHGRQEEPRLYLFKGSSVTRLTKDEAVQVTVDTRTGERMWWMRPWFMPAMDAAETVDMARCYEVSEAEVMERYNVYGGKARLIFDYAEVDESFSLRDRAVAVMRWETIEGASRYISTTDDVSRILFTLRVPEWESGNFTNAEVDFASRHMRKVVYQKAKDVYGDQLYPFIVGEPIVKTKKASAGHIRKAVHDYLGFGSPSDSK